jgi:SsrA-binding protein
MRKEQTETVVATNRKAFHDYAIEDKMEAGIVLRGTEVKSLREGKVNLRDSYASVDHEQVILHNCHITPYSHGNIMNHDPLRPRKLLLHRKEISKLLARRSKRDSRSCLSAFTSPLGERPRSRSR